MKKLLKKAFTVSVVAVTIVWSVGLAALVPTMVTAVTCPTVAGDSVIKVTPPAGTKTADLVNFNTMWYVDSNLNKHAFPLGDVLKTWFADYHPTNRVDLPVGCQVNYPDAKMVQFYPGTLIMDPAAQQLFVMEAGNKKTEITTDVAKAVFGDNYKVMNYNAFFMNDTNFASVGTKVTTAKLFDGMLVKKTGETDVYQVVGGKLYKLDGTLPSQIGKSVYTVSATLFDGTEKATTSVTAASTYANPAQSTGTGTGTETGTVTGGDLTVSLSANTPSASNVVVNVDNVVFGRFILKAGSKDVIVNSFKIGRQGLGATGDFSSVTLYDGSTKLGSTKSSWHSDGYMTYNISGGWTISAGTSKELTLVAKLASGHTGTYNALGLLEVSTNGSSVGGLPVYGNQMTGVSVTVGTVTMTGVGLTSQSKNIGTNEVTLAQFKLALSSTEDGYVKKITLKNKGANGTAADTDLKNISLYKGTTLLAGPVSMVTDKVVFVLNDPLLIEKSKNETFKVVGDVVAGLARTVEFLLDATTDLEVTGKTYSTNLSVTATDFDETGDSGTTVTTITGAELNVSLSSVALDTMDDKEDLTLGTLTLSAGSTDVKITDLNLVVDETAASGEGSVYDLDEFEMLDNTSGAVYSGTNDSTTGDYGAGDETWSFTDEIYLEAGKTYTYTVRGDVPASVTSTASYKINTTIDTTNITAETVPDGDTVTLFSVGSIVGKAITVKAPTITVKGIALTNANAVVNDDNVILFKGTLEASADKIHVEQIRFEENGTVLAIDNWSELGFYLVEGGNYVEKEKLTNSQMTTGTLDFNNLDFYIENGAKVTFVVKGKLASTLTGDTTLLIDLNYVAAKDSDSDAAAAVNSSGASLATDAANTEAGTRTLTMTDKGILYISMLNTDTDFNKDRIVLAGTDFWAGKLKIKADYETITIEDLIVTSTQAANYDSIEELCIYSEKTVADANKIGCTNLDSRGVATFDNINAKVTQGTHYWYMYVRTNGRGTGSTDTADSEDKIEFYITTTSASNVVARGDASGHLLTFAGSDGTTPAAGEIAFDLDLDNTYGEVADYQTANTKKFYVAANKISNVQFVSSYGGETVNSNLAGTGAYTAAIIAVTVDASSNTDANGNALKVGIANFRLDVDKFASTTMDTVTIERIGGTIGAQSMTGTTGDSDLSKVTTTAGFFTVAASSTLTTDSYIEAGTTAYFVVKANITGLSDVDDQRKDWFRFDMDDLTGTYATGVYTDDTDNAVDWYDDAITADSTVMFNALFLDTTKLTGTKVSE